MKVRVALSYDDGEEIYDKIVDLGKYDRDRHGAIEHYDEEASQIMRDAMENWLIFPGAIITITAPDEKERACYSLKEAILEATEQAGGEDGIVGYLAVQALANPAAFMSLLGKVLPMTIADAEQNRETKYISLYGVGKWPGPRANVRRPLSPVSQRAPSEWRPSSRIA